MFAFRTALLLVLLECFLPGALAQQYRLYARRYGIEEGLPHRQVNNLIQDRRGFIWAATSGGVVRFDGRQFKVFNKTDNGLNGDIVDWIAEDADGYIWACHTGKNPWLDIIDPVSGTVIPANIFFKTHPIPVALNRLYRAPYKTSDGRLIFGVVEPGGWMTYHPQTGWTMVTLPELLQFKVITETSRQTIWGLIGKANSNHVLVEMDAGGKMLQQFDLGPGFHPKFKKGETGHPGGFFVLKSRLPDPPVLWDVRPDGSMETVPILVDNPYVEQCSRIADGNIQVQFPKIFDSANKLLLDISREFPEIDGIQYLDYLCDNSGNIWFATAFGLVVVDVRQDHFQRLLYDEHAPGGRGYACRGLLEKNGKLFVNTETTDRGRFLFDLRDGSSKRLEGAYGYGISTSADGNIWTECNVQGVPWGTVCLAKAAPDGTNIQAFQPLHRNNGAIFSILEENTQRVLLGHVNGISIFNPQTGTAIAWPAEEPYPELAGNSVTYLGKDRRGRIWACTDQGFYLLGPGGGVLERHWSGGTGAFYLPYDNLYHFYEDEEGVFWIATAGSGLIRWKPDGQEKGDTPDLTLISRKNGLLNGVVYAIYEDSHAHLWLPTDYGIAQLDKKSLQVRHVWLESDGLTHNEFNRVSHCRGADGTLYFGGLNGVTAFQPDDFYAGAKVGAPGRQLVVSDFNIMNESDGQLENQTRTLLESNQITMHPGDRYIQLEFALLDYASPEKVTYTWKIEGISKDWESLKEPVLRLSSLPFGSYRLRIRAQAADGVLAVNELDFHLDILAPFYLRWWFILLVFVLIALGIRFWLSWRIREHRREQERLESEVQRQTATIVQQTEKLQRLDEAKSRFFANISHELRTPLTLLLGPVGSMLKGKRLEQRDFKYAKVAQQHGKQLMHLVNEILDLSKMESGKMTLQETAVSIQPFLRRVISAFESHAERLGILFVLEYQLTERLRVLADLDKLHKVLNNLLSNAMKFTPPHSGGCVRVQIENVHNNIRIGVHDTGRGIHPEDVPHVFERFYQTSQTNAPIEGGTGIGLALCREFIHLMQGRIWVESVLGQGSHFYVEFPLKEVLGSGEIDSYTGQEEPGEEEITAFDASDSSPAGSDAPLILLVEDNESMRDYVQSILAEKYRVVTAENGRRALNILENAAQQQDLPLPELIVSDIMMPVMDGFQLLENLKTDDRWRHIPVIMLTARADIRDKLRALRTGVDDYLLKPFEEDELLARVDNLLQHYRNRRTPDLNPGEQEPSDPPVQTVSAEDQRWLEEFEILVEKRLGDFDLTAEMLAEAMAMSRSPFFRHLKRLTGLTPAQYLDEARFQKARRMFEQRAAASVKSVAYTVGFRQVKHFSQNYKKRFGKLPSEYA